MSDTVKTVIATVAACAAIALVVLVGLTVSEGDKPAAGFSRQPSSHTSSKHDAYPGCSFDGNYENDKPGACPNSK